MKPKEKHDIKPTIIKQIVPAGNGWVSMFREDDGMVWELPVAVWAVVTDSDGFDSVVGMSGGEGFLDADDSASNFIGYKKND